MRVDGTAAKVRGIEAWSQRPAAIQPQVIKLKTSGGLGFLDRQSVCVDAN